MKNGPFEDVFPTKKFFNLYWAKVPFPNWWGSQRKCISCRDVCIHKMLTRLQKKSHGIAAFRDVTQTETSWGVRMVWSLDQVFQNHCNQSIRRNCTKWGPLSRVVTWAPYDWLLGPTLYETAIFWRNPSEARKEPSYFPLNPGFLIEIPYFMAYEIIPTELWQFFTQTNPLNNQFHCPSVVTPLVPPKTALPWHTDDSERAKFTKAADRWHESINHRMVGGGVGKVKNAEVGLALQSLFLLWYIYIYICVSKNRGKCFL